MSVRTAGPEAAGGAPAVDGVLRPPWHGCNLAGLHPALQGAGRDTPLCHRVEISDKAEVLVVTWGVLWRDGQRVVPDASAFLDSAVEAERLDELDAAWDGLWSACGGRDRQLQREILSGDRGNQA